MSTPGHNSERRVLPFPGGYSLRETARLVDLSEAQIRTYTRARFLEPRRGPNGEQRYSFQDLVLLRTARELTRHLSPRKVTRALRRLREQLPRGRGLATLRITTRGENIIVRDERTAWEPESGQTLLDLEMAKLVTEVAPLQKRAAEEALEVKEQLEAEDWYDLGCELEISDPEGARDAYRRALELEPRHPDAHINLGRLLHEQGDVAAAERHYRVALDYRPRHATAAYDLGVALQDLGRPHDAIRAYERAIAADPRYVDAHYNLAQVYENLGRGRMALKHLQIYRRLSAGD
jgi:tetratricopeptide (TPR) repeat protein